MPKPIVALVGRPNVGKSTLFNRLAGERLAVVHEAPGTTRDRMVAEAEWNGVQFDVVDTGGLDPRPLPPDAAEFLPQVRAQAEHAVGEADAILFLVDVAAGVNALDHEVADVLRRWQTTRDGKPHPPILLVVNKADNADRRAQAIEFYALGLGEPIPISAKHGTGTGELLDRLIAALGRIGTETDEDDQRVKIAIVGRPNVGKSSLLNKLLGEQRVIVSPVPGTTRDAIDTQLEFEGTPLTLIDTAGIRRRGRIKPGVEKYSVLRALRAIERADVSALMVDALEGTTAQDAHIAGMILEKMKSVVLLVNKWDAVPKDSHTMHQYSASIRQQLKFLDYVPVLFISALDGTRVEQVLPTALLVQEQRLQRVPTGQLNRILLEAQQAHAPPSKRGVRLKLYYGSQVRVDPPTFVFHVNDPELVHFSYERHLENRIREAYGFIGTPLRLSFRKRGKQG